MSDVYPMFDAITRDLLDSYISLNAHQFRHRKYLHINHVSTPSLYVPLIIRESIVI